MKVKQQHSEDWKQRRQSKRHELGISIRIKLSRKVNTRDNEGEEEIVANIVDISQNGLRLRTKMPLEFQEKVTVVFPDQDGGEIQIVAEVRWVAPCQDSRFWLAGCLLGEAVPETFLDQLAINGKLDRRSNRRYKTNQNVIGRWEMSQEDFPIKILDVSAHGVRFFSSEPAELGTRIRLRNDDETSGVVVRTVWQQQVEDGYFIGCHAMDGLPYSFFESSIARTLQQSEDEVGRYQVLTFCGLSLILVLMIRDWFF